MYNCIFCVVVVVLPLIEIHLFIKGNEIFRGNEKRDRYGFEKERERENFFVRLREEWKIREFLFLAFPFLIFRGRGICVNLRRNDVILRKFGTRILLPWQVPFFFSSSIARRPLLAIIRY